MSYFFCELSIKIKVPLLSVVSDCISVPKIEDIRKRAIAGSRSASSLFLHFL